ncbi:hypothetical protein [Brevundimonas sp. Root1279]|uniref:hypothetical protein n=1 Tax=Brevundimonas sp. Root1279 TaxID=1736443 RepID=UPI0006F704B0|nr:hypothetical protein [Brevundimonas sp. Root1279]KQW81774.1 hypothetical protein ASC65_10785 [Brevundimonas sp. Root1279]
MSRLASIALIAAVAIAIPATVGATPQSGPTHNTNGNPISYPSTRAPHAGMRGEYETFIDGSTGSNLGAQSLDRIDRANRISTLIELRRCDEALALARDAGDRQMALRTRQICRPTGDGF